MQNKMTAAALRNKEGNFVLPTLESTSAAAAGASKTMPDDFRLTLVDAPGKGSYGICGLTWLLVYKNQKDEAKGRALVAFLKWAIRDGQKMNAPLLYAPIPAPVVEKVDKAIRQINYRGKSLY
jgi:phosphate transport system substrate-binding protein